AAAGHLREVRARWGARIEAGDRSRPLHRPLDRRGARRDARRQLAAGRRHDLHADAAAAGCARLSLDAQPLDPELLRELAGACGDERAELGRLEHDRLAALREDLALEPLVAADGDLAHRTAADEAPRAALDLVARD